MASITHALRIDPHFNSRVWVRLSDGAIETDPVAVAALELALANQSCDVDSAQALALPSVCATVDGANPQEVIPVPQIAPDGSLLRTLYFDTMGQLIAGVVAQTDACDCPCPVCEDPTQAGLSLAKAVTSSSGDINAPAVGDTITYTLTVTNTGTEDLTDIIISDPSATVVGSPIAGPLVPGASADVTATVVLTQADVDAGVKSNQATATATGGGMTVGPVDSQNPGGPGMTDLPIAQNPSATLVKTATPNFVGTAVDGDTIDYLFEYTNTGNVTLDAPRITDFLLGLTDAPMAPATLAPGASATLAATYNVTAADVTAGTPISNSATAVSDDPAGNPVPVVSSQPPAGLPGEPTVVLIADPGPLANTDLRMFKSVSDPTPTEGDTITFDLNPFNAGPESADNISVMDLLPAGLTYVGHFASQGTYNPVSGTWAVGTIPSGQARSLQITATVDAGTGGNGPIDNTAVVSSPNVNDTLPGNETGTATINPVAPPVPGTLVVSKSAGQASAGSGDTITFDVQIQNTGASAITGLLVRDQTPAGATFVSFNNNGGSSSFIPSLGNINIASLAPGATETVTLTYTVDAGATGSIDNQANYLLSTESLTAGSVLTGSASTTISVGAQADLQIVASTPDVTPVVGQPFDVVFTVTNLSGSETATNISSMFGFPYAAQSTSISAGTYDPMFGGWTLPSLAPGASETFTVTFVPGLATAGVLADVTGSIMSSSPTDPNASNNTDLVQVTPELVPPNTDLSAEVSGSFTGTVTEGQTQLFTITAFNIGSVDVLQPFEVIVDLPPGFTYNSIFTIPVGTYNPVTGIWTVPSLAAGVGIAMGINTTVDLGTSGQVLTVTVSINAPNVNDPNPANDTISESWTVN